MECSMFKIQIMKSRYIFIFLVIFFLSAGTSSSAEEVNSKRPDFTLPDLDGNERSISEWDGKAMLVNFWATWCIPCLREIPMFSELQTEHKDKDFQVLGVAVDTPDNVREYLERVEMYYPTLVEEQRSQDVARKFSDSFLGLPFTAFLDHEGRVLWIHAGEIHRPETDIILEHIWDIREGNKTFDQAQTNLARKLKELRDNQI